MHMYVYIYMYVVHMYTYIYMHTDTYVSDICVPNFASKMPSIITNIQTPKKIYIFTYNSYIYTSLAPLAPCWRRAGVASTTTRKYITRTYIAKIYMCTYKL